MSSLRDVMPETAMVVDLMREMLGVEVVNRAIKTAEEARAQYAKIHAEEGVAQAEEWRRANWRKCTFYAPAEGEGRSIGIPCPFDDGVTPCIDPQLLREAEAKLAAERQRDERKRLYGKD